MRKNPIGFITSLLLIVSIALTSCDRHQLTQDEIDSQLNQQISQTAKDLLARPTSGKALCMLLTYKDLENIGIDIAYKESEGGDTCYSQTVYLDKSIGAIYMSYYEPPTGTPLRYDAYTNYHIVSDHNAYDAPDYRTDTDTITIHNTPVIREYTPIIPHNTASTENSLENTPFVRSECTLFTRIPQGIIHLTYTTSDHHPTPKPHICGITKKALTLLLNHATTGQHTLHYCLTISPTWLKTHKLTTYPPNNYCQQQTYYYQPNPQAKQQKTTSTIMISILNAEGAKYYDYDTKSTFDHHTIYTRIRKKDTYYNGTFYKLFLPTTDHKTLSIYTSSQYLPLKDLEHIAKQITLYQIHHNLPQ